MSSRGYMLLVAGLVFGGALFSQVQSNRGPKKPVDVKMNAATRSPQLPEGAMVMVGEVAFHHNGTVITCDSAVRYSDRRIDCFRNVIINKDSTYVYGDRAEYNGDINLARVYSPVVKVTDGDATLYTYNFTFNTATNVGRWFGGGVMYQKDNVLESESGYFYSDQHELVAFRGVEMRNDSRQIISDSVRYNTETRTASFYTKTHIWGKDGEIIRADRGRYNTRDSTYFFWGDAYVLDQNRETWADTIDFRARTEDLLMHGNIQIDDDEHKSSAFGDYGRYWGERGETMLTRRPSLLNYNADQGNSDTLYMRADTVFMYVRYPSDSPRRVDSMVRDKNVKVDEFADLRWIDSLSEGARRAMADSLGGAWRGVRARADSLGGQADSIMRALYPEVVEEDGAEVSGSVKGSRKESRRNRARGPMPDFWPLTTPWLRAGLDFSTEAICGSRRAIFPSDEGGVGVPTASEMDGKSADGEAKRARAGTSKQTLRADSTAVKVPFADTLSRVEPPVEVVEPTAIAAPTKPVQIEKVETPEVQALRGSARELTARADALKRTLDYLTRGLPPLPVDSVALALARRDSLARADSTLRANPKAYKKHLKALRRAEKAAAKEEFRRQKDAKHAARIAEKAAARARKIAQKKRLLAQRRGVPYFDADSLGMVRARALADSLVRRDSLLRLDSTARAADSLDRLSKIDTTATATPDTTMRIFRGWRKVKIWRKDMQAVCDSVVGFSVDSTLHMYTDPVLWNGESQIVADSITLRTAGGAVERADFFGGPIMSAQVEGKQFNQVTGRTMTSRFRDSRVYRHDVNGNAQALYYMQEEGDSTPVAFIVMSASEMTFLLDGDSLRYIVARENVDWPVYPPDQIPSDQPTVLKGFKWLVERKPALADVFDRRVRLSERAAHEALPRPAFPIAARIARRREYLIQNRMWADRNDPLPSEAALWVRSLGE